VISKIKALILDMDGVLWRDEEPIGDLKTIFTSIRKRGWEVTLATNNATRTADQYVSKLQRFDVNISNSNIINSGQVVAHYLNQQYPGGGNVYIIGEDALRRELHAKGFDHGIQNPMAVVVALDRHLSYEKLSEATLLIRGGLPFIATNPDRTLPTPKGLVPGTGSILAALEASSEIKPLIVGKPAPKMYQIAMDHMKVSPEETLVVGDRLETDIAGAQSIGCKTALVLSGVTTEEAARQWDPHPDWIAKDLNTLIELLPG
jgi:4-nitrophenyl phosphatase